MLLCCLRPCAPASLPHAPASRSSRKETKAEQEAAIREAVQLHGGADSGSFSNTLVYLAVGAVISALPLYLFHTPVFGAAAEPLSLENDAAVIGLVTAVSALAMTVAYQTMAKSQETTISEARSKRARQAGGKGNVNIPTGVEAAAWSVFANNLGFVVAFVFLAFYMLPGGETVATPVKYAASVGGSALFMAVGAKYLW